MAGHRVRVLPSFDVGMSSRHHYNRQVAVKVRELLREDGRLRDSLKATETRAVKVANMKIATTLRLKCRAARILTHKTTTTDLVKSNAKSTTGHDKQLVGSAPRDHGQG